MSKENNKFVTGVYRSKDNITNFKIRVRLKQEKCSVVSVAVSNVEEREFSWQEKVFSPFEVSYYKSPGNCHSSLDEKYHQDVTELYQNGTSTNRLFTYTDNDDFASTEEGITTHASRTVTPLVRGMADLRRRQTLKKSRRKGTPFMKRDIVDYNPGQETIKRNHFLATCFQTYYILADLSASDREEEVGRSEYILCTLCWDLDNNVLTVTPDFSSSPYIIETDGDSRNLYLYWLEHTSESITAEAKTSEAAIINKLSSHQTDIRQQQVSLQFDTPHHGALLTFIAGEIISAKHFEADNLFVHYLIELPEGWSCKSPQYLSGVTQTCNTHRRGVAHFGYLFQLSLISNVDMLNLETDSLPHLYIEVLSCDWWGCTTSEGYGCISLPCVYGQHDVRVPTWRPVPVSIAAQMRRHFLGGSPELVNLTHCGVPSDSQNKVVSKYGLPTVTSGELDLRLNIVRQSQALSPAKGKASGGGGGGGDAMLLERLSTATLVSTVNNVLVAFRRARERMMRARQGL